MHELEPKLITIMHGQQYIKICYCIVPLYKKISLKVAKNSLNTYCVMFEIIIDICCAFSWKKTQVVVVQMLVTAALEMLHQRRNPHARR